MPTPKKNLISQRQLDSIESEMKTLLKHFAPAPKPKHLHELTRQELEIYLNRGNAAPSYIPFSNMPVTTGSG